MVRTIIGLDPEEKRWLDHRAREERVPMAEIVRRAIHQLRAETERREPPFDQTLEKTAGIWRKGDGLAYQDKMREEWPSHP
ncbi:MAG: CopG family transcriptional regulator [Verrucomicrobiota bacterium]